MRMRFVRNKGLAITKKINSGAWGAVLLSLLLLAFSQEGVPQETAAALKLPQGGDTLDVPYRGNREAMTKLNKAPAGIIADVSTAREGANVVISVASSCQLSYQEFDLSNPPRLVVDFFNAENRAPTLNFPIAAAGVKQLRVRQFQSSDPKIARLVFDLAPDYGSHDISVAENSVSIVFHPGAPVPSGTPARLATTSSSAPDEADLTPAKATPAPHDVRAAGQESPATTSDQIAPRASGASQAQPPESQGKQAANSTPVVRPVISDLSISEIPRSALASAASEPTVSAPPPPLPPKEKIPAPPKPVVPPESAGPVIMMNGAAGNYNGQPLTLDLVNISLVDFFRLMSEEGGINVVMDPGITGSLSIKVVKVPWDQIFEAALVNNALEKQVDGNLVRIATKKTMQAEAKQREDLKKANLLAADVETRVRRLNYAKASNLIVALKDQLTVRGTIVVDERTGSLVLTDIPSSLDKAFQLIQELDTPEPQVEIEARIVSANRDFARDIGVQFGFVQGNLERVTVGGPNTFGTIGGTRPSATPKNTYAGGNPVTGRGASQSQSSESGSISTGPNSANNNGNFNINLPSLKPFGGLGLSVGNIFDTFLLDAAITAGESKGQAKLISQPKLVTQNNSPGTITQGLRFPVQVVANNTVTVQFQNAALTLTVTPQITSEGNIVLDLKVENNTPDFTRQVQGIPSIRTSESNTRVLVSDGGTTIIGGILIENEQNQTDGVPGLASLPIFGNLFKRTSVSRNTQEVLFFVTPRIVK